MDAVISERLGKGAGTLWWQKSHCHQTDASNITLLQAEIHQKSSLTLGNPTRQFAPPEAHSSALPACTHCIYAPASAPACSTIRKSKAVLYPLVIFLRVYVGICCSHCPFVGSWRSLNLPIDASRSPEKWRLPRKAWITNCSYRNKEKVQPLLPSYWLAIAQQENGTSPINSIPFPWSKEVQKVTLQ